MIAKKVKLSSIKKSSFKNLVNYIANKQGNEYRVKDLSITNCHSYNVQGAIAEVMATQALNKRSSDDKTYHLIVSFRGGESPEKVVLEDIESEVCKAIGFEDHQRISAVHNDTDNLHIHIAINKIHPETGNIITPYRDYEKLSVVCQSLEIKHNLERDNHNKIEKINSRARDGEEHSGVQSLITWIRHECQRELESSKSWSEFNDVLAKNGLTINKKGNGLVIQTDDGITVKASSISRGFSKSQLESRLGKFKGFNSDTKKEKDYLSSREPLSDDKGLYKTYIESKQLAVLNYNALAKEAALKYEKESNAIRKNFNIKRWFIKKSNMPRLLKKALYKKLYSDQKRQMILAAKKRNELRVNAGKARNITWADWLKSEAEKNNLDALKALRNREKNISERLGDSLKTKYKDEYLGDSLKGVTKSGTVFYKEQKSTIADRGGSLELIKSGDEKSDSIALLRMLKIASTRNNGVININGSDEFKEKILAVASKNLIEITFTDPKLNERLSNERNRFIRKDYESTDARNGQRGRAGARAGARIKKPCSPVAPRGKKAEGNRNAGLRLLPLGSMDNEQKQRSNQSVLSNNESIFLQQRESGRDDNRLRWAINPTGVASLIKNLTPSEAVDKYIAERNEKSKYINDIPLHKHYNLSDKNKAYFNGVRRINDQYMALLERDNCIEVIPISEYTANRLKNRSKGEHIQVSVSGKILLGNKRKI